MANSINFYYRIYYLDMKMNAKKEIQATVMSALILPSNRRYSTHKTFLLKHNPTLTRTLFLIIVDTVSIESYVTENIVLPRRSDT